MDNSSIKKNAIENGNFLVTGGAGFIGSHLCDFLINNKAGNVVVLDDLSTGFKKNVEHLIPLANFRFIEGSITDVDTCLKACQGIDVVLHHAALGSVPRSIENPVKTNEVNVNGFVNMLFAAKESGVKKFIYASSSSVYGDDNTFPKTEHKTGNLLSPYAVSKYTNEKYAAVFASLYNIQTVGFRYFNVFGERQNPEGAYAAVIPKFIDSLLKNTPGNIYGTGNNTRDFTYVNNVVEANYRAIISDLPATCVMNIACGGTISVNEIYNTICSLLKQDDLKAIYLPDRKGEIKDSFADISVAEKLIGYKPQATVFQGLENTVNWFSKKNHSKKLA